MATTSAQQSTKVPGLLDLFKSNFALTPNHARPLSDRIVEERFDSATGQMRPVTEREYVERSFWGCENGHRLRQVWSFQVDGVALRFNDSFEMQTHHGVQYASSCETCGNTRWNNADVLPQLLCRKCRARSGWCFMTNRACATAYKSPLYQCRCDACRAWKAAKHRRLAARKRSVDPVLSLSTSISKKTSGGPVSGVVQETKNGVYHVWPPHVWPPLDGWDAAWWLPESVQDVMDQFEMTFTNAEAVT